MIIRDNTNTTKLCNELKAAAQQYPTLSKQEERALIKKYKHDRETLNKLLFMHNIRIVFNCAKKYIAKTNDFDNLVQEGMYGLSIAASRFDINKNVKFITYATIWVLKYMKATFYGKQVEVDKRSMSLNVALDTNLKSNNGNETTFENYVNEYIDPSSYQPKNIVEEISSNEQIDICTKLMKHMKNDTSLSSTDKNVFYDLFYNREKPRDIADKYSLKMSDVNDIKKKILAKFKDVLHTDYSIDSYSDLAY